MAKNKGGLGRGLGALMGDYSSMASSQPAQKTVQPAPAAATAPATPKPQREVIRQSDLSDEDIVTIKAEASEKNPYSHTRVSAEPAPVEAKAPVVEAVPQPQAKKPIEYPNNGDGVVIKEVTDRKPVATQPKEEPVVEVKTTDEVPINLIFPNPDQPRTNFDKEELEELAASIKRDGLLQPILVRERGNGYEIIAGERRWQASKLAGLTEVPVRIKEADDYRVLELALIENLQRSDLNPIEEAYGYKRMMERGGKTQSEVAAAVSKGRSTIANALRLLDLPEAAQQLLFEGVITAGHARAILSIPSAEGRMKLTEKLRTEKLSVRETEAIARLLASKDKPKTPSQKEPTPKSFKTTAKKLSQKFGNKVKVRNVGGKNKIEIEFKDEEDLQRIFDLMNSAE